MSLGGSWVCAVRSSIVGSLAALALFAQSAHLGIGAFRARALARDSIFHVRFGCPGAPASPSVKLEVQVGSKIPGFAICRAAPLSRPAILVRTVNLGLGYLRVAGRNGHSSSGWNHM